MQLSVCLFSCVFNLCSGSSANPPSDTLQGKRWTAQILDKPVLLRQSSQQHGCHERVFHPPQSQTGRALKLWLDDISLCLPFLILYLIVSSCTWRLFHLYSDTSVWCRIRRQCTTIFWEAVLHVKQPEWVNTQRLVGELEKLLFHINIQTGPQKALQSVNESSDMHVQHVSAAGSGALIKKTAPSFVLGTKQPRSMKRHALCMLKICYNSAQHIMTPFTFMNRHICCHWCCYFCKTNMNLL